MTASGGEHEVLVRVDYGIGRLTLNRPRTINALNQSMVLQMAAALSSWVEDSAVTAVVIDGAGDRGLCAGGDIRAIYADANSGGSQTLGFWRDEYRLNAQIARYPKPVVALMDGLVMGGGVGISAHASHRVVTDRSVVGMPEVRIGMVPDVGGTYLLSRAPGLIGTHLALTAGSMTGADAVALGLADRRARHDQLDALIERIAEIGADRALAELDNPAPDSTLISQRHWIDDCYRGADPLAIVAGLRSHGTAESWAAADAITAAAPTAVSVTLRAVRIAASMPTLEAALEQEFGIASRILRSADLVEGIRAQVIDKDRQPAWSPARLEDVTPETVDAFFVPSDNVVFPSAAAPSITSVGSHA